MFQTPWVKDNETAVVLRCCERKPLGGGNRNKPGEALYLAPRLSNPNIFARKREYKKLCPGGVEVFIPDRFGTRWAV
jgi:hypothetical protein